MAGIYGIAVTPDLYYWDCPRHQEIMGRYPQPIKEVLRRPEDIMNTFDTCNIWDGEVRMGVIEEMRRRINKSRWERWGQSEIRSWRRAIVMRGVSGINGVIGVMCLQRSVDVTNVLK